MRFTRLKQCTITMMVGLLFSQSVIAGFTHTGNLNWATNTIDELDLAYDGSNFYTAGFGDDWASFDSSGNAISTASFSLPGTSTRGITFDSANNTIWANDLSGVVGQYDASGNLVSSFNSGLSTLNSVAFDALSNTLWLADFGTQIIRNVTTTGTLLSQFNGGQSWTGLAHDAASNTLLAIASNDNIFEFTNTGTSLGIVFNASGFPTSGNEFGLAYDSTSATLYVQGRGQNFANVLSDSNRATISVPEPSTLFLFMTIVIAAIIRRRVL